MSTFNFSPFSGGPDLSFGMRVMERITSVPILGQFSQSSNYSMTQSAGGIAGLAGLAYTHHFAALLGRGRDFDFRRDKHREAGEEAEKINKCATG
jgi:hypothetical protein